MTIDQIITIVSTVIANGVILVTFRVSLEHRLTKLETHVENIMRKREPS